MDKDNKHIFWNADTTYSGNTIVDNNHTILTTSDSCLATGSDWTNMSERMETEKLIVDGMDVGDFMKTISRRFLVLQDDFEKHEKYPALKDLYEQYKVMEALLK